MVVIPDPGTKKGDTELKFEYRVEGEKIPPTPPKPVEKPPVKADPEDDGLSMILIIVCGVLVVLVLVCCCLYIQYSKKLSQEKKIHQDVQDRLAKAEQNVQELKQ